MRTPRLLSLIVMILAVCAVLEGPAAAQALVTASVGNVFGGDAPSKKGTYAIAIGGGGAHGIGSEIEFSETRHFFETADGGSDGKVLTLILSIFVVVPINVSKIRPYGIFGYGFIRQRTASSVGGVLANLSDDDVGYSAGGGVTFQLTSSVGIRGDVRHFKVRTADGLSFQRLLVGVVFGG